MTKTSKFANIISTARQGEAPAAPETQANQPIAKTRGRPAGGKRSNPEYEQVTAYIRRDTYKAVKIALLERNTSNDFSQLVEELLSSWVKSRT